MKCHVSCQRMWRRQTDRCENSLAKRGFMAVANSSGFSLIELIIGAGIMGIFVLSIGYLMTMNSKTQVGLQSDEWIEQYRAELLRALQDEQAFAVMVADPLNTGFDCLRTRTDCSGVATTPERILVKDRNGKVLNDTSQPNTGFDPRGKPCDTYDSVNGNDSCPYRIGVSWRAFCTINCMNPEVRIRVDFLHKPAAGSTLKNVSRYNFKLYRNSSPDLIATTCANQGGTLVGNVCLIDSLGGCAPGQAVVGFTADSDKICQELSVSYNCPAGQYLQGVDVNGNAICSGCM